MSKGTPWFPSKDTSGILKNKKKQKNHTNTSKYTNATSDTILQNSGEPSVWHFLISNMDKQLNPS